MARDAALGALPTHGDPFHGHREFYDTARVSHLKPCWFLVTMLAKEAAMIELTAEQAQAIAKQMEPMQLVNPLTQEVFVLVCAATFIGSPARS